MIHTILPQEALLPQQPLPPTEWLPCCEGWVQVATAADGTQTVQGVCSTDPATRWGEGGRAEAARAAQWGPRRVARPGGGRRPRRSGEGCPE